MGNNIYTKWIAIFFEDLLSNIQFNIFACNRRLKSASKNLGIRFPRTII